MKLEGEASVVPVELDTRGSGISERGLVLAPAAHTSQEGEVGAVRPAKPEGQGGVGGQRQAESKAWGIAEKACGTRARRPGAGAGQSKGGQDEASCSFSQAGWRLGGLESEEHRTELLLLPQWIGTCSFYAGTFQVT